MSTSLIVSMGTWGDMGTLFLQQLSAMIRRAPRGQRRHDHFIGSFQWPSLGNEGGLGGDSEHILWVRNTPTDNGEAGYEPPTPRRATGFGEAGSGANVHADPLR